MIRTLAIILALSTSYTAFTAVEVHAQVTDQTDKSEEDWRKSKKKHEDPTDFKDILNRRTFGSTIQNFPQGPVDALPAESRRHLMKERAKVIATSEVGKTPDAPYVPSEAAKTDPQLQDEEKQAWTAIMTEMQIGDVQSGKAGAPSQGGNDPNKVVFSGKGGGAPSGQKSSVLRGGSSGSVADIMAQIKGMKVKGMKSLPQMPQGQMPQGMPAGLPQGMPQGQAPTGQMPSGQNPLGSMPKAPMAPQGQMPSGQAPAGQTPSGQAPQKSDTSGQNSSDTQTNSQADAQAQAAAQAQAEAQAQAAAQAQSDAQSQTDSQADAQAQQADAGTGGKAAAETIGPLERIKQQREQSTSGTSSSASDYLKKYKKPN